MVESGFDRVDVPRSDLHFRSFRVFRVFRGSVLTITTEITEDTERKRTGPFRVFECRSVLGLTESPSYSLNSAITGAWSLGFSRARGALSIQQPVHLSASEGVVQIWSMRRPRFRCHA